MLKYLTSLLDPKFKTEVIKILKKLRKIIKRNVDHSNNKVEKSKDELIKIRQFNC